MIEKVKAENMRTFNRFSVVALILPFAAGGCQVVDNYSDRAVNYNQQAEQTQDQDVLLNIVRASMRRPLEFTGVQTVSGTASASGTLSLSLPIALNGGTTASTISPGAGVSGGPTFTVGVLDTQDFFEGIMKPIPSSTFDLYDEERYPPTLLFNLFIDRIVIRQLATDENRNPIDKNGNLIDKNGHLVDENGHFVDENGNPVSNPLAGHQAEYILELDNAASFDQPVDRFQMVVNYLINLGLTTRQKQKPTTYGPWLTPDQVSNLANISKAVTAGLELDEERWCDLDASQRHAALLQSWPNTDAQLMDQICAKDPSSMREQNIARAFPKLPAVLYRAQKTATSAQFCFQNLNPTIQAGVNSRYQVIILGGFVLTEPSAPSGEANVANSKYACDPAKSDQAAGTTGDSDSGNAGDAAATSSGQSFAGAVLGSKLGVLLNDRFPEEKKQNETVKSKYPGAAYANIDFAKPIDVMDIVPRSTEGVIYYLGELLRRQTNPEFNQARRVISVQYGPPTEPVPYETCPVPTPKKYADAAATASQNSGAESHYNCEALFLAKSDLLPEESFVSVDYHGDRFGIPKDRDAQGLSSQVVDIVTQLIALNKSAKDLPTTSVFTVISPP